jgi:hypothetical protein
MLCLLFLNIIKFTYSLLLTTSWITPNTNSDELKEAVRQLLSPGLFTIVYNHGFL